MTTVFCNHCAQLINTSLASHFVPLQASPAGLLGRFAPSKFSKKKCVSIDSKWSKTQKNAKKKLLLWRASRVAQRAAKRLTYPCGRFAPSGFAFCARIVSRFYPSGFALATYPMSLPGSQGVSMPSFMPIGLKLWALEGYIHTDTHTDRQSSFYYIDRRAP